jgi:hypothetical protein
MKDPLNSFKFTGVSGGRGRRQLRSIDWGAASRKSTDLERDLDLQGAKCSWAVPGTYPGFQAQIQCRAVTAKMRWKWCSFLRIKSRIRPRTASLSSGILGVSYGMAHISFELENGPQRVRCCDRSPRVIRLSCSDPFLKLSHASQPSENVKKKQGRLPCALLLSISPKMSSLPRSRSYDLKHGCRMLTSEHEGIEMSGIKWGLVRSQAVNTAAQNLPYLDELLLHSQAASGSCLCY